MKKLHRCGCLGFLYTFFSNICSHHQIFYPTCFWGMQVGRLLLPGIALLSIPAADVLLLAWRRVTLLRYPIGLALGLSAGIVVAVGSVRAERFFRDPAWFLERHVPHFADIRWMNAHLDPVHDRVASQVAPLGYLRIPWMNLDATFQVEIGAEDRSDPGRLRAALKRQGFTHVFGGPAGLQGIEDALVLVHANPASRVGGPFFRSPLVEPTAVFALR